MHSKLKPLNNYVSSKQLEESQIKYETTNEEDISSEAFEQYQEDSATMFPQK